MTFSERRHTTKAGWPAILIGQPFPNPPMEDGRVFLACVGDVPAPVGVALIAENGEVKYRSVHELPRHGGTIVLHLAEVPPGSYKIHVHCTGWEAWRPLTIAPQVVVPRWRIVLEKWKEAVLSVFRIT